jgi:hypothetical protein
LEGGEIRRKNMVYFTTQNTAISYIDTQIYAPQALPLHPFTYMGDTHICTYNVHHTHNAITTCHQSLYPLYHHSLQHSQHLPTSTNESTDTRVVQKEERRELYLFL